VGAVSSLESAGLMREMNARLAEDPELAAAYAAAHERYLARREAIEDVPEIAGVSAGGMPTRVKCLHVHLAQSLAEGPGGIAHDPAGEGGNPFGDEVRERIGPWWADGPCV
jgi:hypothetical protein